MNINAVQSANGFPDYFGSFLINSIGFLNHIAEKLIFEAYISNLCAQ